MTYKVVLREFDIRFAKELRYAFELPESISDLEVLYLTHGTLAAALIKLSLRLQDFKAAIKGEFPRVFKNH